MAGHGRLLRMKTNGSWGTPPTVTIAIDIRQASRGLLVRRGGRIIADTSDR